MGVCAGAEASYGLGVVVRAELAALDNCTTTADVPVRDGDGCSASYHGTTLEYSLAAYLVVQGAVSRCWHPVGVGAHGCLHTRAAHTPSPCARMLPVVTSAAGALFA